MPARKAFVTVAPVLVGCLISLALDIMPAAAHPRRPPVRVEKQLLINASAPYSFSLPIGWTLQDGADERFVRVVHQASGATFAVLAGPDDKSLEDYYAAFVNGTKMLGKSWTDQGGGDVLLDGQPGKEIRGLQVFTETGVALTRNLFVKSDGHLYAILATIPQSQIDACNPDIDRMIASFKWSVAKGGP
jgi:4-amino-4-deoxy-L-arabinose transferase-like glycosyltransferase